MVAGNLCNVLLTFRFRFHSDPMDLVFFSCGSRVSPTRRLQVVTGNKHNRGKNDIFIYYGKKITTYCENGPRIFPRWPIVRNFKFVFITYYLFFLFFLSCSQGKRWYDFNILRCQRSLIYLIYVCLSVVFKFVEVNDRSD